MTPKWADVSKEHDLLHFAYSFHAAWSQQLHHHPATKYMDVHVKLTDGESREKALKTGKQLCSGQVSYPPCPITGVIFTCCWILSPDFLLA